jgi:hypothetical protein
MNIVSEDLKNKNSTFCMNADGFYNFSLTFCEEHLLVSMKSLTSCDPFSNPHQKACYGFLTAACDYESLFESRL